MFDIILSMLCFAAAVPMIFTPQKILERPKNKIRSISAIRITGFILVVLGILNILI